MSAGGLGRAGHRLRHRDWEATYSPHPCVVAWGPPRSLPVAILVSPHHLPERGFPALETSSCHTASFVPPPLPVPALPKALQRALPSTL